MKMQVALAASLLLMCAADADAQYPAGRVGHQRQAAAPRASVRTASLDHGRSYAAGPIADPAMSGGPYAGGYAAAPAADCGCNAGGGGMVADSYVGGEVSSCGAGGWHGHGHHGCCLLHGTGDMPQHMAYCPGPHHGYYYFRPYHVMHVFAQQDMVVRWGGDPRHPYENSIFERVYGQLGAVQPTPAEVVSQPAPIFRGY